MLRYYPGQDVLDFHRDAMTPRRLAMLVNGLPPDSATRYAMAHPEDVTDSRWTDRDYLSAHMANTLHALFRLLWVSGQIKGPTPAIPDILPPAESWERRIKEQEAEAKRLVRLADIRQMGRGTKRFNDQIDSASARKIRSKLAVDRIRKLRGAARPSTPATPEMRALVEGRRT